MKYKDLKIHPVTFLLLVLSFFASASIKASEISRINEVEFILPPPPTTQTITYGGPYCANAANLTPTVANFVSSSAIYFSQPGGLNLTSSNGQINMALSAPGTYTVSLLDNGVGSCSCTARTTLQINALPQLSVTGTFSVCKGATAQLFAGAPNVINFTWSNGSTGSSIIFTPSVTTVITVTATGINGCKSNKPQTITVKPTPTISVQGNSVCAGSPATLIASSIVAGNISYVWSPGPLQGNPVVVTPQQTTVYQAIGTLDGCSSQASSYPILVVPSVIPEVYFSYITPLCSNSGDPLPILSGSFATGGVFASPDGSLRVNPNTGKVDFSNMAPGEYSVSYTLATNGCSVGVSAEAVLLVNAGGNLTADPLLIITEGESVNLNVSGGAAYAWDPVDFLSCTDCESPVATPLITTKYCATEVTDGCILKACTDVVVLCLSNADFAVPNAFTPNGDKNNDEFCLQGWTYCVTDFKIIIYDRWGEKVYESTDPEFCWNGKFNGEVLNSGVYVYAISAKVNRETKIKKGNITLMR